MSTRATVNLDTYSLSLLTAKEDILNPRSSTNWAIFTYDGITNKLKLADSGAGGVAELAAKFHISKPQYGLCKVGSTETGGPRIAMISWVGQNVDDYRKTECASHIPAIKSFFKEAHAFISAEKVEDVTEEKISEELSKSPVNAPPAQWVRRSSRSAVKEELVGTNYRKTNAAMEMRRINRDSFWARAEREEEDRKDEERRRAAEDRRRLEKERVLKERRDADERDRKMNEKLEMIEEQRRKQAEQEEELRRKEKSKWDQQQREHEEHMRARLSRSESIEKAQEAAALVSQRTMNPREFFRQLSSSSSKSPTSTGSSRTGKPFRRYQRSLTDTACIFQKAEERASSTVSSPRSPPLGSPFSRGPGSPFRRASSPPTSPDFRPVTSPRWPRAPVSPQTGSPLRSPPAVVTDPSQFQAVVEPEQPTSPTEPSAPPASPSLLASLSRSLSKSKSLQSCPDAPPSSPPNSPTEPEHFSFQGAQAPQAPTAPLPERPKTNTDLNALHTELVSDITYKVQAVLVEEDEEEEEEDLKAPEDKGQAETEEEPRPRAANATGPVQTGPEQEGRETTEEQEEKEEEEGKKEQEEVEQEKEEEGDEVGLTREAASLEESVEEVQAKEDAEEIDQTEEDSTVPDEPSEATDREEDSSNTDNKPICHEIKRETVVPPTNGIASENDALEQNGIERSLSPSDTELSSPELAVCFNRHGTSEEDDAIEDQEQEISENGQKVLAERQMCVRALYDYQAEDESEISFEPGDIIRDVETVDKAWWRGWSKDGRQGLFPANYVETV